jgi:hypothetical protein
MHTLSRVRLAKQRAVAWDVIALMVEAGSGWAAPVTLSLQDQRDVSRSECLRLHVCGYITLT